MKITISDKAEAIGYLAATKLLEEISVFEPSESKDKFVVGLSSGRTMDRVYNWFVEIIKDKKERGENLPDLSNIQFVQTEAFYPENPKSEHGLMAKQISEHFIKPLEEIIGKKIEVFYPGTVETLNDMKRQFIELTKEMDIDFVTLHESGAVKGLRDADMRTDENKPLWAQGRMQTRDIQLRPIQEIVAGEVIKPDLVRTEDERSLSAVMVSSLARFSESEKPTHFVTEGYNAYKKAKKVIIITEGENKAVAVDRLFTNIRLTEMNESVQSKISRNRKLNIEGTASGSTIVDIRRGVNTEMYIDQQAASKINEGRLRSIGVEVSHFVWEDRESGKELGTEFSWEDEQKIR